MMGVADALVVLGMALSFGGTAAHATQAVGRISTRHGGMRTVAVYSDGKLSGSWRDWSWTPHTLSASAPVGRRGRAMRVSFHASGAIYLRSTTPFATRNGFVEITLNGGAQGGQHLGFELMGTGANSFSKDLPLTIYLPPDYGGLPPRRWMTVRIPLTAAIPAGRRATGIVLREVGGRQEPVAYIGSIILHAQFS